MLTCRVAEVPAALSITYSGALSQLCAGAGKGQTFSAATASTGPIQCRFAIKVAPSVRCVPRAAGGGGGTEMKAYDPCPGVASRRVGDEDTQSSECSRCR